MIIDKVTNIVYFSDLLRIYSRFTEVCKRITTIRDKHQINYYYLTGTKDIWCRDYMPIQKGISDFIQFRYEPTYLKNDPDLQSDTNAKIGCSDHFSPGKRPHSK